MLSALPPKANIKRDGWDVSLVPRADMKGSTLPVSERQSHVADRQRCNVSRGVDLKGLTFPGILKTKRFGWLSRTCVPEVMDFVRHLRECLACLECLR